MSRLLFSFFVLLLAWRPCFSQTVLSLDDCLRLATGAKSQVDVARQQLAATGQGVRQAAADFFPQARLLNAYNYNSPLQGTQDQFSFVAANGIREYVSQFTVAQEFDVSGRLRAELDRAKAERQAGTVRVRLAERDLKLAVKRSYYEVLRDQHQLKALQEVLLEAEAFGKRAAALEKGGEVGRLDVARARVQVAAAEQAVQTAALELRRAEHELLSFWTTAMESRPTLDDLFAKPLPVPEDQAGAASAAGRPELGLFDAARLGFKAEARKARANLLPQPSVVLQYGINSLHWTGHDRGYAALMNLTVPVFDWGKALAAQKQANLQADQVDTQRAIAERGFARELADARAALRTQFDQVSTAEQEVQNAAESLRLAKLRYEAGEGSALEVVDSQSALARAQVNYFTAIRDYFMARAETEFALGR